MPIPTNGSTISTSGRSMNDLSDIPLNDILPQRPPFVMIDALLHCDGDTTETVFTVRDDCVFCDPDGGFSVAGMVENIAQTCAARIGYLSRLKGGDVKIGVIGAVNNMIVAKTPSAGDELHTTIVVEEEVFNMTLVRAETRCNGNTLATCKMKIALTDKKASE